MTQFNIENRAEVFRRNADIMDETDIIAMETDEQEWQLFLKDLQRRRKAKEEKIFEKIYYLRTMKKYNIVQFFIRKHTGKFIYFCAVIFAFLFGLPSYNGEWQWINLWDEAQAEFGDSGMFFMTLLMLMMFCTLAILFVIVDASYEHYKKSQKK